jgi:hypothetical protein
MDRESEEVLNHLRAENEFLARRVAAEGTRKRALRGDQEPYRRDGYLGPDPALRLVVLRANARGTQLSDLLASSTPRPATSPHRRSIRRARSRASRSSSTRTSRPATATSCRSASLTSVPTARGSPSAPTSTATNSTTSRCARWPDKRRSTTNSMTSTTASRGPRTADTSSTPASTTRSAPTNCGVTSWAPTQAPTYWSSRRMTHSSTSRWRAAETTPSSSCNWDHR